MFELVDPSSGETYQFRYIVTQFESEGPERLEYRHLPDFAPRNPESDDNWKIWPEDMPVPSEVNDHFHGGLVVHDFDVPSFFKAFSAIRAAKDDLKKYMFDHGYTTFSIFGNVVEAIEKVGDLDENYSIIAKDALNGYPEARGMLDLLASAYDS